MVMETAPTVNSDLTEARLNGSANGGNVGLHSNLDELFSLLRNEIPESRQTLLETQSNLETVADYCATAYLECDDKRGAFENTKNYTTHSLASVAYQINTLAYNILHMLELQTNQISEMESQLNYISQKFQFHNEKVARRKIALLTTPKTSVRQPKVLMPANQEKQGKYVRKTIDYSLLDEIGHGVKVPSQQPLYRTASSSGSSRMSGIQTLGPKSSMSSLSHYHHYNTLGGSGPAPTTKPPTPPQAVRPGYGTVSRSSANKEYRALAPPIAPPQVPKNYEPNYPIGHPKNPLTQRQNSSSSVNYSPGQQYGMAPGHYHPGMSSASLNSNNSGQYGMSLHTTTPPPPPPPDLSGNHVNDSLPDPPPPPHTLQHQTLVSHQASSYDARNTSASPPLPPPPPENQMHSHHPQHPMASHNTIYSSSHRQANVPDWVPPNYIEKVIAIYDYLADKDDELTFQENSVIYVTRKNDDGWYEGVMNGVTGLFPGNYVEPCL